MYEVMNRNITKIFFVGIKFNRIAFIIVLSSIVFIKEAHSESKSCQLNNPDDKEKSLLEKLAPLNGKILTVHTVSKDEKQEYKYNIGICSEPEKDLTDVGAVQYLKKEKEEEKRALGRLNDTTVLAGENWILLTYYDGDRNCNGDNTIASIMIVCNPNTEQSELKFISEKSEPEPSHCIYMFEFGSKLVCPPTAEAGLSHGSVFCILFFTSFGIYLILGFLYQRLVIGAQGLEQIPNYAFWREFGSLQADGCDFICRCGSKREATSYRGIDDRLPREDERDDQLLNM